jgi:hypothetical protein
MLEIVANVALQTLTNYSNRLADTAIDSPVVEVATTLKPGERRSLRRLKRVSLASDPIQLQDQVA